jgi:hypothetical protein
MPETEIPNSLRARLAAELDAVRPEAPFPGQARYRRLTPRASHAWLRFASGAALGAVVAFLAGLAVGSAYPATFTTHTAGAFQRLRQVVVGRPAPPASSATPSPTASPESHATPPTTRPSSEPEQESPVTTSGAPSPAPEPESSGESSPEPSSSPGSDH